ncbi:MAG: hypothetical protein ACI835_004807 [Planctomycetota bacterium]|jgi:hypothetical protein
MVLVTVMFFLQGFVLGQKQSYQVLTIIAYLASVLSQELSALVGLQLGIAFLLFTRHTSWGNLMKLVVVAALAILAIVVDFAAFQTTCQTHTEGVSPNVEASIAPNFLQPYNTFSLFFGSTRLRLVLSVFFFLGFVYALRPRNRSVLALYFFVLSGALLTNLMVTHISLRYQYWAFPFWILLGVYGIRVTCLGLSRVALRRTGVKRHPRLGPSLASLSFAVIILTIAPWRIPGFYSAKMYGDATGAFRYAKNQLRPGDQVVGTEPHSHAALIEAGQVDYYISVPLLYDFKVRVDGEMRGRNGGACVIGDMLDVVTNHERDWLVVNREKLRLRGKNMR